MSWQTFTLGMTDRLVWPIVVLLLVGLVFPKPVGDALGRLAELSLWGVRARFRKRVDDLAKDAAGSAPTPHPIPVSADPTATTLTAMLALAPTAPRAATETAFELMVAKLRKIMADHITIAGALVSPYAMTLMLINAGVLTDVVPAGAKPLAEVVADAQSLMGRVINGAPIDGDQAASYVNTIVTILDRIQRGLSKL